MKKRYYDLKRLLVLKYAYLKVNNPWYHAYLRAAMNKYEDSLLYRLRATEFGDEFAMEHFAHNSRHELPLFKNSVIKDKALMAKIIFLPFSVTFRGTS